MRYSLLVPAFPAILSVYFQVDALDPDQIRQVLKECPQARPFFVSATISETTISVIEKALGSTR